jgi:hypothetical protein
LSSASAAAGASSGRTTTCTVPLRSRRSRKVTPPWSRRRRTQAWSSTGSRRRRRRWCRRRDAARVPTPCVGGRSDLLACSLDVGAHVSRLLRPTIRRRWRRASRSARSTRAEPGLRAPPHLLAGAEVLDRHLSLSQLVGAEKSDVVYAELRPAAARVFTERGLQLGRRRRACPRISSASRSTSIGGTAPTARVEQRPRAAVPRAAAGRISISGRADGEADRRRRRPHLLDQLVVAAARRRSRSARRGAGDTISNTVWV